MNRSQSISSSEEPQNGFLIVRVRTAQGALPIPRATVTVLPADPLPDRADEAAPPLPTVLITDESGNTPRLSLPAGVPAASLSPGGTDPFRRYHVIAQAPGFERASYFYLPIYPGVTALQTASLLPLPGNVPLGAESPLPSPGQSFDEGTSPDL